MKIYIRKPEPLLFRINIKHRDFNTEHITVQDTTMREVLAFIRKTIEDQNLSPFQEGVVTRIEVRETNDGLNGKCKSLSFKGLLPREVKELLVKEIEKKDK